MLYRTMPKFSSPLSILGFGGMRFPEHSPGHINEEKALLLLQRGVELGINYFDTAFPYHLGTSEAFLGKALKKIRGDRVFLATKLPHWSVQAPQDMEHIFRKQLTNLQREHIDFYLLHNLNGTSWERLKKLGILEFMNHIKAQGDVGTLGFSFHASFQEFRQIVEDFSWDFCQIQYNYLDTENQAGTKGLHYAAAKNLGVVVMGPLRGGNLAKVPPREIRERWEQHPQKRTPQEWALRWVWDHPQVTTLLSGMETLEEVEDNVHLASQGHPNALTREDKELLERTRKVYMDLMPVGCTGCRYCLPCPEGVNIPLCFEHYNTRKLFRSPRAKYTYTGFLGGALDGKPGLASQCVNCGKCVPLCPQRLSIPSLLQEVAATMEGFHTKPLTWIMKLFFKWQRRKAS